jgi:hypothetical protein
VYEALEDPPTLSPQRRFGWHGDVVHCWHIVGIQLGLRGIQYIPGSLHAFDDVIAYHIRPGYQGNTNEDKGLLAGCYGSERKLTIGLLTLVDPICLATSSRCQALLMPSQPSKCSGLTFMNV